MNSKQPIIPHDLVPLTTVASAQMNRVVRLTEYRTALITAATTGKIDVRNVKVPAAA